MRKYVAAAAALVFLGCQPAPADLDVSHYVNATLTALAPQSQPDAATATVAPTLAETAVPADTLRPTLTPMPSPTATNRPTATPTATAVPVEVPEGWLSYETLGDPMLTVWYPPTWWVKSEESSSVSFEITERNYAAALAGLFRDIECRADQTEEETLRCLSRYTISGGSSRDTKRIISSEAFASSLGSAYAIEVAVQDYVYESWSARLTFFGLRPDGSTMSLTYLRVGTQLLTDAERDLARTVFDNLRVSP